MQTETTLPEANEQIQTTTAEIKLPKAHASRGRVLVVDDEEMNRMLLRDPLETHHFEVVEAANGSEALARAAEQRFDVVLLDLMMPGMDGFEVCRRLKKHPDTAHLPILMVTALSERKERLMAIAAGANDFLNKPVDVSDVILRVVNAVHAKQLFDQLQAERKKSERLLLNVLPPRIIERMRKGEINIADTHAEATVLLADLVGFTTLSGHLPPGEVVRLLNEIFSGFDLLTDEHGLEKIKTVGDAYMAAGGVHVRHAGHAAAAAELALAMQLYMGRFNLDYHTSFQIRIGISTGSLVSGVIGRGRFAYDIWGDTVNIACRLEELAPPGGILVSEATSELLGDKYRFGGKCTLSFRGRNDVICYTLSSRV